MRNQDDKLHQLIAEQAAEWYVAHVDGGLSQQQSQAFMHWLRTSPVHVAEYLRIEGVARDATDAARASETSWQSLVAESGDVDRIVRFGKARPYEGMGHVSRHSHRPLVKRKPISRWAMVAAVSVAAVALMFGGFHLIRPQPQVQQFSTRHREQRSLQLPDHTFVQLDTDSSIVVSFDTHRRRVTILHGQAYFGVAKDPARPFSVLAGNALIRDIGTTFSVDRQSADVTVTVASGRIQVWKAQTQPSLLGWLEGSGMSLSQQGRRPLTELEAGQQVQIASTGEVASNGAVDVQRALAWTRGQIAFDNQSIATVAAQFNRYNATQIRVDDPRISTIPISGVFDAHDVSTFITFLDSMPGVRIETHGQQTLVVASQMDQRHRK